MKTKFHFLLLFLLFSECSAWEFFDPQGEKPFGDREISDFYRLSDDFTPTNQHIKLKYDSIGKKFIGQTKILIEKTNISAPNSVTLNVLNLTFSDIMVTYDNQSRKSADFKVDLKNEQLTVQLPFNFTTNLKNFTLEIHFESQINGPGSNNSEDLDAAYWLINENNQTIGIVTQFQASLARTVFPCFDEPKFRTVFSLDLDISELGSDYSAFSNERQISTPDEAVKGIFRFGKTKPISSYLVAFAVLNMSEHTEVINFSYGKLSIRVIFPNEDLDVWENGNLTSLVGYVITYSLSRIEDEFDFPWTMSSKLDIVFVDHNFGGMENTGMITMDRNYVWYNAGYLIATLVHEIIHQWTGGILTCDWWSNVWLNEGITTYVENQIVQELIADGKLDTNADWSNPLDKHATFKIVRYVESDLAINDHNSSVKHHENYSLGSMVTSMLNTAMNDTLLTCLGVLFRNFTYQSLSSKSVMEQLTKCPFSELNATEFMRFWLLADDLPILKISFVANDTIEFSYDYFCSPNLSNGTGCPDPDRTFEPEFAVILRDSDNEILQTFERIYQNNSKYIAQFNVDDNELFFANAYDPIKYIVQYDEIMYENFFDWLYEEFTGTEIKLPSFYTSFIFDMLMLSSNEYIDFNWLFRLLQEKAEILDIIDLVYDKYFLALELDFYSACLNGKLFSTLTQNETDLLTYSCTWNPGTVLCEGDIEIQEPSKQCDKWYKHNGENFKQFLLNKLELFSNETTTTYY